MAACSVTSVPAPKRPSSGSVSSDPGDGGEGADEDRQPDPVDALGQGAAGVAGPEVARDARGGPVGEEDAQPDHGLQHHGGEAEAGQGGGAEVADDRGVGEQEQRLGRERQEGGDGESHDLAILGPGHRHRLVQ